MNKRRGTNRWLIEFALVCGASFLCIVNLVLQFENNRLNSPQFIASLEYHLPPDETPPTIILKGGETTTVARGTVFHEPGYEAYDNRFDVEVEVSGEINCEVVGQYVLTYTAKDTAGNTASKERLVNVVEPTGIIYLTFDDGPGEYTSRLLDVLAKHNVKVTFFVTGRGDDEIIKREYDEGHTVALHTFSHDYAYIYSSVENYFDDLYSIQNRVKDITGHVSTLIRFPGGSSNLVSARYDGGAGIMSILSQEVANRGFTYFDWNVSSGDAGAPISPEEVYENVVTHLIEGGSSVVLQHDIKDYSVDAVESIIQYGVEHGFVFARLDASSFSAHHRVNN